MPVKKARLDVQSSHRVIFLIVAEMSKTYSEIFYILYSGKRLLARNIYILTYTLHVVQLPPLTRKRWIVIVDFAMVVVYVSCTLIS